VRVGLFFGSFNPIHIGHLVIADVMADQTDLEQVWFVVSPLNPFKSSSSLLHEFDRLKMVELAIEDNFKFRASDVEFNMPRPSYTADTLAYLSDKYPQNEFKLIIGEDNLVHFHKWKNYESVLENFGLYVYPRPQVDKSKIKIKHENIKYIDSPMLDISATFIRSSIRNDHSVQYLLPSPVIDYIRFKKFYQ
jgi:nicotinate-nucleotide adenylyltransferase